MLQPTKKLKIDSPGSSPRSSESRQNKKTQSTEESSKLRGLWTHHYTRHLNESAEDSDKDKKESINIEELIDEEINNRIQKTSNVWGQQKHRNPN